MKNAQVFFNKLSNFFDGIYTLPLTAILLFIGYAFNLEIYFIIACIFVCVLSLIYGKSLKTLLAFLVLTPVSFTLKFNFSKTNLLNIYLSAGIIFAAFIYFVVVNFKQIKTSFKWGKLIGGFAFALCLMFFVGVTKTSYIYNLYYLVGVLALIFVYAISTNSKDYSYLSKLVITFALLVNFELAIAKGILVNSSILVVNILAICCLFTLGNDWFTSIFSNIIAMLLCVFSICYASGVIAVITVVVYLLALIYFAVKNPNRILVIVSCVILGAVIVSACNWCSLGKVFGAIASDINNYTFADGLVSTLSGVAVAFGLGFTSLNFSVASVIASIGVIGCVTMVVLVAQVIKRIVVEFTFSKMFLTLGLVGGVVTCLVVGAPVIILPVAVIYLSLFETENLALSRAPFGGKGWQGKVKKYEDFRKTEKTFYERMLKRPLDFTLSLIALIVLSPLFLVLFIASKISIGGKAIFCQYRPGKNGKVFKLYKFRSMNNKTDDKGNLLPDNQRITKFGKIIRKLSVDEIPQLVNILKGDMSIVGTRPRIVRDIVFYDEYALKAYSIRPGLTSLSQISGGRATAPFEDIIEKDVTYAENITFWGDIYILFKTVFVLFEGSDGEATEGGRKDYWYSTYLLRTGKISQEQFNQGLKIAEDIINNKGTVGYTKELHND